MKVVIAGGSGHVGAVLIRHFVALGCEVVVLSREFFFAEDVRSAIWDGKTIGPWLTELDGSDVVINLAGRSVNCRYSVKNLNEMMASRIDSVKVVAEAIALCKKPPKVWLQASTATIYAHRLDAPNDEFTGIMGGHEPGAPFTWKVSIDIAKAWEAELDQLMDTQLKTTDFGVRKKLYDRVQAITAEQLPFIFLLSPNILVGASGHVGNFRPAILEPYALWNAEQLFVRPYGVAACQ